jgi:hypothetical protein
MMQHNEGSQGPFAAPGWLAHAPHDWPVLPTGETRVDYQAKRGSLDVTRAVQMASWVAAAVAEWDEFLSHRITAASTACSVDDRALFVRLQEQFRGLFDGTEQP